MMSQFSDNPGKPHNTEEEYSKGSAMASDPEENEIILKSVLRQNKDKEAQVLHEWKEKDEERKVIDRDEETDSSDTDGMSRNRFTHVRSPTDYSDLDDETEFKRYNKTKFLGHSTDDESEIDQLAKRKSNSSDVFLKKNKAIQKIQRMNGNFRETSAKVMKEVSGDDPSMFSCTSTRFDEFKQQYMIEQQNFELESPTIVNQNLCGWRHRLTKVLCLKHRFCYKSSHIVTQPKEPRQNKRSQLYKIRAKLINANVDQYKNKKTKLYEKQKNTLDPEEEDDEEGEEEEQEEEEDDDDEEEEEEEGQKLNAYLKKLERIGQCVTYPNVQYKSPCAKKTTNCHKCAFCKNGAEYYCRECAYYSCPTCLTAFHPPVGPFQHHSVLPTAFLPDSYKCDTHGQSAKLFCHICSKHWCEECANTTCRKHFRSSLQKKTVDKERASLVAGMERLSQAMSSLNVYEQQADEEALNAELQGLLIKEKIRQEFVSFHDLLIDSQAFVLRKLDEEVSKRQEGAWRGQEMELVNLRNAEAELTSNTVDLLQSEDTEAFMQDSADLQERYEDMESRVSGFQKAWAKQDSKRDRKTYFLDQTFSLYQEKKTFSESIQNITGHGPKITFYQKMLLIDNLTKPVPVEKHVMVSGLGPSTGVRYRLQLVLSQHGVIWETTTNSLQGIELNTYNTQILEYGARYLLKLYPTVVVQKSDYRQELMEYPPSHMLIVVRNF